VRYSTNGGSTWAAEVTFPSARAMVLNGLTPGTTYTVQMRAVGGTMGFSGWSDPVSHMVT
jgi:hypothetical protein